MTRTSQSRAAIWSLTVAFTLLVSACGSGEIPSAARGSGSVAISQDSALVYAVDSDNGLVAVVDTKTNSLLNTVPVGARPYRVVVGKDDSIYVANRGSRSVSVIHRGDWRVATTLATDVDPTGLAISDDGKTLYVTCATAADSSDYGTLAAFDTTSMQRSWTMKLPDEPRAIALLSGSMAAVSLYKAGDVAMVDLSHQTLAQTGTALYAQANQTALANGADASSPTFHPRAMTDVAATPDGTRVFATGLLSREVPLIDPTPDESEDLYPYGSKGPNLSGSVATPAVATFDVRGAALDVQTDDLGANAFGTGSDGTPDTSNVGHPQLSFATSGFNASDALIHGPTVAVVDMTGSWLFVVNRDSKNVMIVPTRNYNAQPQPDPSTIDDQDFGGVSTELPSVYAVTDIGAGADGIALMGDNESFFVYSQFDHQLSRFELSGANQLQGTAQVTLAGETLSPTLAAGRRSFYDATDRRVSSRQAAISCASCHLEGREDSHVWFAPDGPRQTPSLAGRGMVDTAPYYWSGEFTTLTDFLNTTIAERMGGTGIDQGTADTLNQYVASLPAPENPNVQATPTDAQQRGAQVFGAAGCGACHNGQWMTNDAFANVGTLTATDQGNVVSQGINVPSLRGLARTAPYLHDGSVATLEQRIRQNPGDKHGVTSGLSDAQVSDLVEYLKSL
jgi:YVTN family beta-propeller protein